MRAWHYPGSNQAGKEADKQAGRAGQASQARERTGKQAIRQASKDADRQGRARAGGQASQHARAQAKKTRNGRPSDDETTPSGSLATLSLHSRTHLDPGAALAGRDDVKAAERVVDEPVLRLLGLVPAAHRRDALAQHAGDLGRVGAPVVEREPARALEAEGVGAVEEDGVREPVQADGALEGVLDQLLRRRARAPSFRRRRRRRPFSSTSSSSTSGGGGRSSGGRSSRRGGRAAVDGCGLLWRCGRAGCGGRGSGISSCCWYGGGGAGARGRLHHHLVSTQQRTPPCS